MLRSEGYESPQALIRDWALLTCFTGIEQYRAECELFQKKYAMSIEELDLRLHQEKGHEDFEKEDDLADWQFSSNALKWWKENGKIYISDPNIRSDDMVLAKSDKRVW